MITQEDGGVALDPVCGTPVIESEARSVEYKHRKYFFCSERCRDRFAHQAERIRLGELAKMGALFAVKGATWGLA